MKTSHYYRRKLEACCFFAHFLSSTTKCYEETAAAGAKLSIFSRNEFKGESNFRLQVWGKDERDGMLFLAVLSILPHWAIMNNILKLKLFMLISGTSLRYTGGNQLNEQMPGLGLL